MKRAIALAVLLLVVAGLILTACGSGSTPTATTEDETDPWGAGLDDFIEEFGAERSKVAAYEAQGPSAELASIDLEEVVYQPGDLPDALSPGKISAAQPEKEIQLVDRVDIFWELIPKADNYINLYLDSDRQEANSGNIVVFLYSDHDIAEIALKEARPHVLYDVALADFDHDLVGERDHGLVVKQPLSIHLAFLRCNAVVTMWMTDVTNDELMDYARLLDGRLSDLLCAEDQTATSPAPTY